MVAKAQSALASRWDYNWRLPWLLAIAIPLCEIILTYIHYSVRLRRGEFPWDGDSISIPIFGSLLLAVAVMPMLLLITWWCVRRVGNRFDFLAWRYDRPVLSVVVTVLFGGMALAALYGAIVELMQAKSWVDPFGMPILLLVAWWFMSLRGALLSPRKAVER